MCSHIQWRAVMADTKRIVVCCDGTWNSPDETSQGVPCPTNVVRMAEAVKSKDKGGVEQKLFYDPGIGSSGGWIRRCFEGATGTGMSKNILDAYRYLIHNYVPGDELYFFGFSRGAFTARSLAGLIRNSGLLRPDSMDMVDKAYNFIVPDAREPIPKRRKRLCFERHTLWRTSRRSSISRVGYGWCPR